MKTLYNILFASILATTGLATSAMASNGPNKPSVRRAAAQQASAVSPPVTVLARKPGRVWESYVREGQHVQQGQTMFKIATQTHTAGHPGHQIDYDVARQQYVKILALHKAGKANTEEVAAAKFQLQMAGKLLNDAPQQVLFHYVDAPISGTLTNVTKSNQVQANSVLGTITADPAPKPKLMATNK